MHRRAVAAAGVEVHHTLDPSPFRLAYVHIGLGETDVAFDWLEKSVEARDWQLGMLKVEPAFDGLRSDARFAALLQRVASHDERPSATFTGW